MLWWLSIPQKRLIERLHPPFRSCCLPKSKMARHTRILGENTKSTQTNNIPMKVKVN